MGKWYGLKEFKRMHLGTRKILCTVLHGVRSSVYHNEIQIGTAIFSLQDAEQLRDWLVEACDTLKKEQKETKIDLQKI